MYKNDCFNTLYIKCETRSKIIYLCIVYYIITELVIALGIQV